MKVLIGMISDLFAFTPTLFLVLVFGRIKNRNLRINKLRNKIKEYDTNGDFLQDEKEVRKSKNVSLPWWLKIIAYLLSFICILICITFLYIKGL